MLDRCNNCCVKRIEAQAILGGLAADQFGLITSAQARERGVDGVTLLRLGNAGLLEPVGRGVYQVVGATPPTHLEIRVAWLRLDPARPVWERDGRGAKDGVVSHRSACLVHGLGDIPAPKVELTVPGRLTTREPWVVLHRHDGPLKADEITVVDGLPVTSAERTVLDLLRDGADGGHIGGVVADAEHRGLLDMAALAAKAERYTERYAMPKASGAELLSALAAQAGQRLKREALLAALADAAAAGYGEALRRVLLPEGWHVGNAAAANMLAPVQQDIARTILTGQPSPALTELRGALAARLAAELVAQGVQHGAGGIRDVGYVTRASLSLAGVEVCDAVHSQAGQLGDQASGLTGDGDR